MIVDRHVEEGFCKKPHGQIFEIDKEKLKRKLTSEEVSMNVVVVVIVVAGGLRSPSHPPGLPPPKCLSYHTQFT